MYKIYNLLIKHKLINFKINVYGVIINISKWRLRSNLTVINNIFFAEIYPYHLRDAKIETLTIVCRKFTVNKIRVTALNYK